MDCPINRAVVSAPLRISCRGVPILLPLLPSGGVPILLPPVPSGGVPILLPPVPSGGVPMPPPG